MTPLDPTPQHWTGDDAQVGPPEPVAERNAGLRDGVTSVDRLVLILISIVTTLTIVSCIYHFAVVNYGEFVAKEVLPSSGLQSRIPKNLQKKIDEDVVSHLADYGTPFVPGATTEEGRWPSPIGSDYLTLWHYTREFLRGHNPYKDHDFIQYVSRNDLKRDSETRMVRDPGVPEQLIAGGLSYFPMGVILVLVFYLPNYFASLALYYAVFLTFMIALCVVVVRRSPGYRVPAALLLLAMFLTSFPIGLLIDRGNIEGTLFILIALGLFAYSKGHPYLAAVLIGLAASPKLTPGVFCALFLLDRKYKALALSLTVLIGSNLVAMFFMHENLVGLTHQILENLGRFNKLVVDKGILSRLNHTLLNFIRGLIHPFLNETQTEVTMRRIMPYYSLSVMAVAGLCLLPLRRMGFSNRVLALTVIMLLFPTTSYDYKLLHLYLAFGLVLLAVMGSGLVTRPQMLTLVLLAVLFSPKSYHFHDYSIGHSINSLTLIALLIIGLTSRLEARGRVEAGRPPLMV